MSSNRAPFYIGDRLATASNMYGKRYWGFLVHLRTIWLFTFSDLKTIVIPSVAFGTINAFCAETAYSLSTSADSSDRLWSNSLVVLCKVSFQVWINLLPFAISNQRQPESITEDRVNKPWRPMPSGRLSLSCARSLMLLFYCAAVFSSAILGGLRQSIMLIILGFWYNNLGGADRNCFERNLINALGYESFLTGALEVAIGKPGLWPTPRLTNWLLILAGVLLTTVQLQDMPDQPGDRLRRRKTVPLVVGDGLTRIGTAAFLILWSAVCPFFWGSLGLVATLVISFGTVIATRTILYQCLDSDKLTFRLWNLWVVLLFLLPLSTTRSSNVL